MKGCRPFTDAEVIAVLEELGRTRHPERDRALFVLGLRTGFRISELLSLRLRDIVQNGTCVNHVTVQKCNMKKKRESRGITLHPEARAALILQVNALLQLGYSDPDTYIFRSRQGGNRPLSRIRAYEILTHTYAKLGLPGKLGTHGMRKTFAKRVYAFFKNDLLRTQKMMGHVSVDSTVKYLSFDEAELDEAALKS